MGFEALLKIGDEERERGQPLTRDKFKAAQSVSGRLSIWRFRNRR